MSSFKSRSDYFKQIANLSRLIAHNRPITDGSDKLRKSFHRVNSQEEFDSAVANWGHYPCVVHLGHSVRFKKAGIGVPQRVTENNLRFLDKINKSVCKNEADAIEVAYDRAYTAMVQFLGRMSEDARNQPCFRFDLNRAQTENTGQVAEGVFGWDVTFYDDNKEKGLVYLGADWFDGTSEEDDDNEPPVVTPPPVTEADQLVYYYNLETVKVIDWTDSLKYRFGAIPDIQVWYTETDSNTGEQKIKRETTPSIIADTPPPDTTQITIELKAPGPGFIIISK